MEELRCCKCNKLLLKSKLPYWIEVKCPRCNSLQTLGKSEFIEFPKQEEKEIFFKMNTK